MQETISVQQLTVGQQARITELIGAEESLVRLGEMGFHTGADITMVRQGTTFIVRLGGSKLCIRPVDVEVWVRPNETNVP